MLELDEAYAVHFVKQVKPRYALLLNVMRDQLDRFGEIDTTAKLLSHVAAATTGTVVLNREDPRIAALAAKAPAGTTVRYFGLADDLRHYFPSDDDMATTVSVEGVAGPLPSARTPLSPRSELRGASTGTAELPADVTLTAVGDHKATFQILRDIRKMVLSKMPRLPLGDILDTSSGRLKQIVVDQVESMETTLAHLLPEMPSNLLAPVCVLVYLFTLDWRMALLSLVSIPVGMAFMMAIMGSYGKDYQGAVETTQAMNETIVEYIGGIEVIKAFNQGKNSYEKFSSRVRANAAYYYNWMKKCQFGMALAYAIASPEVELVGITTCFGNVRVEQSAHNCLAVLDLLGRPEVPVYLGADRPLQATEPYTPPASTALIHGKNGIGGASVPASPYEPVGATSADGNAAVDYLIDAARTYGPDLVYVAAGPLSNLALALERDAAAMMSIGRVVVMGGALTVPGNVSAGAEANMASDPEAADAVLRSGRKLTMVGLDVTHRVVLTRRDIAGWTGSGTMAGCAFASMVEHYIGSYEMNAPYLGGCALHDPLAVAVAIDPTLVGALGCNLRVDLLGEYRGRTICDERRLSDPDKSALVALTVDAPRFLSEFKTRMARVLG